MDETLEKREKRILDTLEKHKQLPKSKIVYLTGIHNYSVDEILNKLENENIVEKEISGGSIKWKLKLKE